MAKPTDLVQGTLDLKALNLNHWSESHARAVRTPT
jgi:hypothetical protein